MFKDFVDFIFGLFTNTGKKKTTRSNKKLIVKSKAKKKTHSKKSDKTVKAEKKGKDKPDVKSADKAKKGKKPTKVNEKSPKENKKPRPEAAPQPEEPKKPVLPPWDDKEFVVEPEEGKIRFHDLELSKELMHAIYDSGFKFCTPIQGQILPHCLEGKDAIGQAQTGTGKTAAFLIGMFSRLQKKDPGKRPWATPRALVVAPTRELVIQIMKDAEVINKYLQLNLVAVFGGMDYKKQLRSIDKQFVDVVFATPGRLLDFTKNRALNLSKVEILVIDEADRMLDMGFIPDMRKIVLSTPHKKDRHTMLFSATFDTAVMRLASSWTRDAVEINVEPEEVAVKSVDQKVYLATDQEKMVILYNMLKTGKLDKVIVFANRRDVAKVIDEKLYRLGIETQLISGEVAQKKRLRTLQDFKDGKIQVLVATDVASRGIHIDGVTHVVNYSLPEDAEDYVHRIGRTGRAGAEGISVSFASEADSFFIPAIEEYIGNKFEYDYPDDEMLAELPEYVREKPQPDPQEKRHHGQRRRGPGQGGPRRGGNNQSNQQRRRPQQRRNKPNNDKPQGGGDKPKPAES